MSLYLERCSLLNLKILDWILEVEIGNLVITDADRDGDADLVTLKDQPEVRGFVAPGMDPYLRSSNPTFNLMGMMRQLSPELQRSASRVLYNSGDASELERQLNARLQ